MDRTYCTIYSPNCNVTFEGFDSKKYTSIWEEIKNEKCSAKMLSISFLETRLADAQDELETLKDDRNFWQKLSGMETEMSKKYYKQYNYVCELIDIILDHKQNLELTSIELYPELMRLLDAESFRNIDTRYPIQVWVKEHK